MLTVSYLWEGHQYRFSNKCFWLFYPVLVPDAARSSTPDCLCYWNLHNNDSAVIRRKSDQTFAVASRFCAAPARASQSQNIHACWIWNPPPAAHRSVLTGTASNGLPTLSPPRQPCGITIRSAHKTPLQCPWNGDQTVHTRQESVGNLSKWGGDRGEGNGNFD